MICVAKTNQKIPENVANEIITNAKALLLKKHIRQSFNGLDYQVRVSHSNRPLVLQVKKERIVTCSTKECLIKGCILFAVTH